MVARDPNLHVERDASLDDEGSEEAFDLERQKEGVGLLLHAARRGPKFAILTFLGIAALSSAVFAKMSRVYSQIKLRAQVNLAVSGGRSGRTTWLRPCGR
jgi:hypothetical protein